MNCVARLLFATFLFLSISATGQKQVKITSAEITFEFVSKNVKGSITGFESQSRIDWENLENSIFKGSVASKTIDTNNGLRNWSLRSGKYFDVDDYPEIIFASREVKKKGNVIEVKGDLNIKGNQKEITILFKREGQQLIGTSSLYSIDYGIKIKKKREDNLVKIKMVFNVTS